MKNLNTLLLLFIILIVHKKTIAQDTYDLLVKNVTIIDVKDGNLIPGQNVFIHADRIVKISQSTQPGKPAKVTVDGRGKFLIPGLWDMHTHNWWTIHFSEHYIDNGVLGVRNMYTPMHMIKPLVDSIRRNLLLGPKYYAAGRVLEGADPEFEDWLVVDSVSKIKAALDTLQKEGSDFVKIYNKIPGTVYFSLVKEAQRRGMRVEGHLPMEVTAIEASNAGQRSFEHLLGLPDLCTKDLLFRNKHKNNWFAAVMNEDDYGTLSIDEKQAELNFAVLKRNNTYVCPTLVVWHTYLHPDSSFEKNPLLAKFPKEMTGFWESEILKYRKRDSAYKKMALKKYENLKKVTYLLYKAGVPLIAGTDAINPYCYPGYSLHREFELLSECGIPNLNILQMATLNAAAFQELPDYGQVREGFMASLVLLEANPLSDIRNTGKINTVIVNGKVLDKAKIDRLKR